MITAERTGLTDILAMSKGGIDNVITMTTTNYAEPGFRFVVNIQIANMYGGVTSTDLYITQNPQKRGILNLRSILINAVNNQTYNPAVIWKYVHNWKLYGSTPPSILAFKNYINSEVLINIWEGYEVGGVWTFNPETLSPVTFNLMAHHGWTNAFDFSIINSANEQSLGYSDFTETTFYQRLASKVPAAFRNDAILVPTYRSQYGVLNFNADDGTYYTQQTANNQYVKISFYQSNGTLISTNDTSYTIKVEEGKVSFVPLHAGSINYHIGLPANTAFYVATLKDINDDICSPEILFYIEDADCKNDPINIAWIGKKGGWNYYNFIKTNQNSIDIERTEYKRPFGDYANLGLGSETPGQLKNDWRDNRQYVSRENMVTKYLTITSDWITEKEFEYLESLMVADVVHWVPDYQIEYIPMIITDNSYIMRRERNSTKYNLTLKLKYAQDYQAINYNSIGA